MKSKHFLFVFLLQVVAFSVQAARVDTVFVKSPSMNKDVKVVYILPDKAVAKNPQACPAVYLLHGYGGNARTWIGIRPELPQIADEKVSYSYALTVRTVGIGIVLRILPIVMKLLFRRNW